MSWGDRRVTSAGESLVILVHFVTTWGLYRTPIPKHRRLLRGNQVMLDYWGKLRIIIEWHLSRETCIRHDSSDLCHSPPWTRTITPPIPALDIRLVNYFRQRGPGRCQREEPSVITAWILSLYKNTSPCPDGTRLAHLKGLMIKTSMEPQGAYISTELTVNYCSIRCNLDMI